jgi:hypothetical protein
MTAAKKLMSQELSLESGTVERSGETLEVKLGSGPSSWGSSGARRAKSCLVAPEVGDHVLCVVAPGGVFVLAVLEGREGDPTRLVADGDLVVQARDGSVAVHAAKGVEVVSGGAVTATCPEIHVRAPKGSVAIDDLGFIGRRLWAEVTRVAWVSEEVDATLTRLVQRAKRVFRFVEEIDQTRAGTVDVRAENLVAVRGENTLVSARVLAKVDGEQIHLG